MTLAQAIETATKDAQLMQPHSALYRHYQVIHCKRAIHRRKFLIVAQNQVIHQQIVILKQLNAITITGLVT